MPCSRSGRPGEAIILVLGLLVLFMAAALAWLVQVRTGARVARFSLHEVQAREMAEAGVAEALRRLESGDRSVVHEGQSWRADFMGDAVDNNGDGRPDSRWFTVDLDDRLQGRYAVLVEDEAAKIHLNAAGNILDGGFHRVDKGARGDEIALGNLPGLDPGLAAAICRWKYGPDGRPGLTGHPDDFRPERPRGDDRPFLSIADVTSVPGIGAATFERFRNLVTLYSYDENVDGDLAARVSLHEAGLDEIQDGLRRSGFTCPDQVARLAVNIKDYFDEDDVPSVVTTAAGRRHYGLEETPYLNEIEAAPCLRIRPQGSLFIFWLGRGEFVELFNPYRRDLPIGGYRVRVGPETVTVRAGAVIPARGFYTIGDAVALRVTAKMVPVWGVPLPVPVSARPVVIREPRGADQYHAFLALWLGAFQPAETRAVLRDRAGNVIEETDYGFMLPGRETRQKNDPRLRDRQDWFSGPATPGRLNSVFDPAVGLEVDADSWPAHFQVKNAPAEVVGELGRVHRGRQWQTINLWHGPEADLKTQDIFTAAAPVSRPVAGRININTAPPAVLANLPFFGDAEAAAVVAGRPYRHIGELGPRLDHVSRALGRWGHDDVDHAGDGYPGSDGNREFLFRRNSSLVTVRGNVFRLLVTGQVVRRGSESGTIEEEDVLAEKKITAIYDRGGRRGRFLRWQVE